MLANVQAIAAAGQLIPSRLAALFLTLERNRQWWTSEPPLSAGSRVSFPTSRIVWQYYPGQGLEIQWLATFGKANGYFSSARKRQPAPAVERSHPARERARGRHRVGVHVPLRRGHAPVDQRPLPGDRAAGAGARLVTVQRTGLPVMPPQQALGIFQTPPPAGVLVKTPAGALYAEYTYAPNDRILNGFIQALVGLYDYTSITHDPLGQSLFEAGDAEARAEVPHYDTGAWSLYDQFGESDLNYHELLTRIPRAPVRTHAQGPPITPRARRGPRAGTRGARTGGTTSAAPSAAPIARRSGDRSTARPPNASRDLHTPPVIALLTSTLHGGTRAGVQVSLSKISTVAITVRRGGQRGMANSATVERGKPQAAVAHAGPAAEPSRSPSPRPTWPATSPPRAARSSFSLAGRAAPRLSRE